jgi:Ca-activated chloride channel family protein
LWLICDYGVVRAQGFLIPVDQNLAPLALKYHRVQVKIQDRAAQTKVEQVFVNSTNRILEATYIFPLPPEATVSNFILYINGKATTGQVLERGKAEEIYTSIVRRMQDPGLLEYMGGQMFRARVFPIPVKGEQKIEIAFNQVVPYIAGLNRYVYPLKSQRSFQHTQRDFTMGIELNSKTPLRNIYSPTHKISIARRGENKAILGFEEERASLDRDFVLYYSVSPEALGINALTHRVKDQDGYFLMMATPKVAYGSKELVGKNITFVLDTSGSMAGEAMKWAKYALETCLKQLNPADHFNVVRFSTDVEALYREMQPANSEHIEKATAFVKRMDAAGGTAIDEALTVALAQTPKGAGINIVVLITDGHPTIGETSPAEIIKNVQKHNKHRSRLFTFGIGEEINIKLLDQIAQQNGGTGDYVKPDKEIAQSIVWFYDKVRYPVMSNIQLETGGQVRLYDIYPRQIPDLFRGGQILLFGRYSGQGDSAIILKGKIGDKDTRYVFETRFPTESADHAFITRLWANRKVAYLLDNIRLHGENPELKNEVIRLAKEFGIVTPYTSYLVVEEQDRWRLEDKGPLVQQPPADTWRRNGGGMKGGGRPPLSIGRDPLSSTPSPASPTEPSGTARRRAAEKADSDDRSPLQNREALAPSSGQKAIETSRKLRKMREQSTVTQQGTVRYIDGKSFAWKQNQWIDRAFKTSMKTIKVKYMSELYFQILRIRPDLRKFFALGSKITIAIAPNRALIIGTEDSSTTSSQLQSFLRK